MINLVRKSLKYSKMHSISRRNIIKSFLLAPVAGSVPFFYLSQIPDHQEGNNDFAPAYQKLHRTGELKKRGEDLWHIMENCHLCPRNCGANRISGERGFCGSNADAEISAFHPHFGEEPPLVGKGGSGTIFMSNCSLRCVFCINWEVSQGGEGNRRSISQFAGMMLALQRMGCPNVNIVTPTHYSPHILLALDKAASKGLNVPLVYNTCGWEREEILQKLDGVVDIYLPDFKYAESKNASKYSSGADSYPEMTQKALLEMHRQVGVAKPAENGLMKRGLMIRHLVMPNNVSGSKKVMDWIADNLPKDTFINIMSQYKPVYRAGNYSEIDRKITRKEYEEVISHAHSIGLTNLEVQGFYRF